MRDTGCLRLRQGERWETERGGRWGELGDGEMGGGERWRDKGETGAARLREGFS